MPTLQYLADKFYEDDDIEYIYNKSQKTASIKKEKIDVTGEYIYTKLEEYPYEFKIDGNLRLAAVDGIEIADNPINTGDFVTKEEYNNLKNDYDTLESTVEDLKGEINTLKNNTIPKMESDIKGQIPTIPMINTNKCIKILSINEMYTATEDCFFEGYINVKSGGGYSLYVDGNCISWIGENGAGNDLFRLTYKNLYIKATKCKR